MESFMTTLLGTALGSMGVPNTDSDAEDFANLSPVPVIPTRAQIADATVLTSLAPPADVVCPICQSHEDANSDEWRIIRHCQHRFHRDCIDTWFEQNVHCPVCRFDVRNHRRQQQAEENRLP
jgi:uncharacterized paraquat-inducible protein A